MPFHRIWGLKLCPFTEIGGLNCALSQKLVAQTLPLHTNWELKLCPLT